MNFFDTLYLKFQGSLTEMDSRLRGNDVISARCVTFTLAVIPAQAGIQGPFIEVDSRLLSASARMTGNDGLSQSLCPGLHRLRSAS